MKKQYILDAATKSFTIFGYKATTMSQIAKQANVGKGTIYTFFKNKEELFDEIINNLIIEMKYLAEQSIRDEDSFIDKANKGIEVFIAFHQEHDLTIKLLQEQKEIGTVAVNDAINRLNSSIITYIKKKIEEAIDKKEIVECDPEMTALIMLRLYTTLKIEWEKDHEALSPEKMKELFNFYILNGLSK
ncbi:TetR/AcrR family transcriptional regulator [Bacillus sp. EAC]|uniref:TetR/AcrR family transcriptional regulator n=1 Tax=Bacillus sp. EAC TaxID=1978338 RepID=UPI000B4454AE|nr:TetR/AcrR family transcriptional regulator [Bacillus sp. EAC]